MAGEVRLSRELNIWEAVGISVALMAPSMAANINPQGMVGSVGRAIPLTFAIATVGILVVAVVVLAKLAGHHIPAGSESTGVNGSPFTLPSGTGAGTLFLGVVFGFLSFAGFEAASTLGEETKNPRRDIPRAILGTAIFG